MLSQQLKIIYSECFCKILGKSQILINVFFTVREIKKAEIKTAKTRLFCSLYEADHAK